MYRCNLVYSYICGRILGRVVTSRLRWWAEVMELVDDIQSGFRPGRSTADATEIISPELQMLKT